MVLSRSDREAKCSFSPTYFFLLLQKAAKQSRRSSGSSKYNTEKWQEEEQPQQTHKVDYSFLIFDMTCKGIPLEGECPFNEISHCNLGNALNVRT